MDQNGFNYFNDFLNYCKNTCNSNSNSSNDSTNCKFGNRNAEASESSRFADSDIPNGFQDLNPEFFTMAASILGTAFASNMPFNIQNALANWLQLLGQSILTFNAQQQYFQNGPGRVYNPVYRNSANPFCSAETQSNTQFNQDTNNTTTDNVSYETLDEIEELKKYISVLSIEVKNLRNEIEELKGRNT